MLKLTVFILITLSCHSTSHSSFQQVNPQCQPNEPTSDTCTDDVNRLGLTRGAFVSFNRLGLTRGAFVDKLLPLAPRVCINNTVANALPIISRSTATPIQIDHSTPPQGTHFALICSDLLHLKGTHFMHSTCMGPPLYRNQAPMPFINTVDSALSIMTTSHSSFQKVNPQCQPNEPTSDTCTDDVNRLGLTRGAFVSLPSDDTASARLIITIGKLLPLTPRVYINNTVAN
eukprot:680619_1